MLVLNNFEGTIRPLARKNSCTIWVHWESKHLFGKTVHLNGTPTKHLGIFNIFQVCLDIMFRIVVIRAQGHYFWKNCQSFSWHPTANSKQGNQDSELWDTLAAHKQTQGVGLGGIKTEVNPRKEVHLLCGEDPWKKHGQSIFVSKYIISTSMRVAMGSCLPFPHQVFPPYTAGFCISWAGVIVVTWMICM